MFKDSGFKTFRGKYKEGNVEGDIDTLAYKGNYLYVIEAKTSKKEENILAAYYAQNIRIEGTAILQLEKTMNYLKNNWNNFTEKESLPIKKNINDITIIPLIITNYFDSDLQIVSSHKISLLELEIILKNNKKRLLTVQSDTGDIPIDLFQKIINQNNPSFKDSEIDFNKNYNLWNGDSIAGHELIDIIKDNGIWKDLNSSWKM